jgi:alpha-tubulin suppressor-like RCC1 family protein
MIYAFGKNVDGQLGLSNGEDYVSTPTALTNMESAKTTRIVVGNNNSFLIYIDGSIYSAGGSEIGRNGKRSIFSRIDSVEVFSIVDVAVGDGYFNLCTSQFKLIGIGKNDMGTLGNGTRENRDKPKLNSSFLEEAIQIQSGSNHVVVLTKRGSVYAFGENRNGQLGDGLFQSVSSPSIPIQQLRHRPVTSISCGNEFTIACTVAGNCYSWGKNDMGQLGLGDQTTRLRPELVRSLKVIRASRVSCGNKHSIVISHSGALFGFGSNTYNEIGLGIDTKFETYPRKIERFSEHVAIEIATGSHHTLVLAKKKHETKNSVYAFGLNSSGQLGLGHLQVVTNIQQIKFNDDSLNPIGLSTNSCAMHSFVVMEGVSLRRPSLPSVDLNNIKINVSNLKNKTGANAVVQLRESVASAFSSISVLNASFRISHGANHVLVDLASIREAYNLLFSTENEQVISTLGNHHKYIIIFTNIIIIIIIGRALIQATDHLKEVPYNDVEEDLSVFFIIFESPLLLRPSSYHIAIERIINGVLSLPKLHRKQFFTSFRNFPSEYFLRVITVLQTYISFCIGERGVGLDHVPAILVLSSLHEANKEAQIVVEKFFYNDEISKRKDFLKQEWYKFNMDKDQRVFNYWQYPFLIDVIIKNNIIHDEFDQIKTTQTSIHLRKYNTLIMNHNANELKNGVSMKGFKVIVREDSTRPTVFMELVVRRDFLLDDVLKILAEIVENDIDTLKLPLKCSFIGEEGNDQGYYYYYYYYYYLQL